MSSLYPFCSFDYSCAETLRQIQAHLSHSGLRVMQTFDLRTARHAYERCSCPNHSMETCDCQLVVLLVFREISESITLVLHGSNNRTWISFAENISKPFENEMRSLIEKILTAVPRK